MAQITLQATDEDFNGTIAPCFCRERAIPQIQEVIDDIPQVNEDGTPKMVDQYTALEWMRLECIKWFTRVCVNGAMKLKLEDNPIDTNKMNNILNNL